MKVFKCIRFLIYFLFFYFKTVLKPNIPFYITNYVYANFQNMRNMGNLGKEHDGIKKKHKLRETFNFFSLMCFTNQCSQKLFWLASFDKKKTSLQSVWCPIPDNVSLFPVSRHHTICVENSKSTHKFLACVISCTKIVLVLRTRVHTR